MEGLSTRRGPRGSLSRLDRATVGGIVAAFGLMAFAIIRGGGVLMYFDFDSILIVVGGTIGATLITYPLQEIRRTTLVLRNALLPDSRSEVLRVHRVLEVAERARRTGALSLEGESYYEPDPFFRTCLQLVVDSAPAEKARELLQLELDNLAERHRQGAQIFQTMGTSAPAMGMIGTLIGLVAMLQNLNDPSKIGPGMATALLTTFYGAFLSYVVFLPLAGKLRARSREEILLKQMTVDGIISVIEQMNPRLIEQRLLAFLPPDMRRSQYGA